MRFFNVALLLSTGALLANAYPHLGLTPQEWAQEQRDLPEETLQYLAARQNLVGAQPAPPRQKSTKSKLVHDAAHPYIAPGKKDIRGPCPGLNTLANHGYINRSGIVTPQEVVIGVQEGYNMGHFLAMFLAFGAHLADGNQLTNLLSIGKKTSLTGYKAPGPAIVGGLNQHGLFEGDASTTRGDAYFGDNFSFNETLFQVFIDKSNQYGGGKYNLTAAAEVRWARIQDSKARNPTFDFTVPRFFTAYGESAFPFRFFVDGRDKSAALDLDSARLFFEKNTFPNDFYRREGELETLGLGKDILALAKAHYMTPGFNNGIGNYTASNEDPSFLTAQCQIYKKAITVTLPTQYPFDTTTGLLRDAVKKNIHNFYLGALGGPSLFCPELFPYGR
ncbi:hypothetical protein OC834_002037 [Tilletia horrida]|uniref:Heme haloperoxidase family profile domain-containing protein n=1 Tax=Tilletia horrida TaxID=155126 RepID=A0AAN6JL34_9BASI|nr:hypothetical protein OC834_002037 [Tilletia horrida]KAK0534190.1 hypothetical protein OC842_002723 [Tilletia horrida]KAK0540648.1 hypothetical protein OC835_000561 [Tilletia horrida]KAK0564849.1 hypothetical protein OC844_001505 [Tilletia horrida]